LKFASEFIGASIIYMDVINKKFPFLLILGLTSLLVSCKTNPPTSSQQPISQFGRVFITANIDSARIYLDGSFTNKFTPDTLVVSKGDHSIEVVKENTPRVVLLEDFANVSCDPCVLSNRIIESLSNFTYGRSKLVVVKFPTNFPSSSDPFYLANPTDCSARRTYYNILFAPTTIIDGIDRPISTDSIDVMEAVDAKLLNSPRFEVVVTDSISGGIYLINIYVNSVDKFFPEEKDFSIAPNEFKSLDFTIEMDTSSIDFSDLVLHTVVTETDIEFSTPPGSNGETKFYDVMRKMLPSNAGESLGSIAQTGEGSFQRQVVIDPSWDQTHLNTVVYIQNLDTKEVFQAGSTFK